MEQLDGWRGSLVEVVEQLTRSPGTLDRHFTTRSSFVMRLESVGVAFSGFTLMLMGKTLGRNADYQVAFDLLEQLSVSPTEVLFVERFGKVAERHTTLKRLSVSEEVTTPEGS